MKQLPQIMLAPNGAHRTKADHAALPVTIAETVKTAKECFDLGARGIHAHVRDKDQKHVLDAGLYRELMEEMTIQVPDMHLQITTEAIGIYTPAQQRQLVHDVMPKAVSVSLKEMLINEDLDAARNFYHWAEDAQIAVQHIVYTPQELSRLIKCMEDGIIPPNPQQILFVLGRYSENQQSNPKDLTQFLKPLETCSQRHDWAVCAFGSNETACIVEAIKAGGKGRIGFENSLWNADGSMAENNAERVNEIMSLIER